MTKVSIGFTSGDPIRLLEMIREESERGAYSRDPDSTAGVECRFEFDGDWDDRLRAIGIDLPPRKCQADSEDP